jgi:hypothetical protein
MYIVCKDKLQIRLEPGVACSSSHHPHTANGPEKARKHVIDVLFNFLPQCSLRKTIINHLCIWWWFAQKANSF